MCRYAMSTYKDHFACFECRKAFKRRLLWDVNRDKVINKEEELPAKCPECGQLMANMGKDFEAPKKQDIKSWKHIQLLYEVGITFHSCGCTGPGYIPRDKVTLLQLLKERRITYSSNLNLGLKRLRTEDITNKQKQLHDAVESWQSKLQKIDAYIASLQKALA